MKNIHLLPTEKPTWLHKSILTGVLRKSSSCIDDMKQAQGMNIYITSDEEIKEGDWVLYFKYNSPLIHKVFNPDNFKKTGKKIILTTDQDLIKDGVQAIDDEFLEWFVKNPSCEKVEVQRGKMKLNDDGQEYGFPDMSLYKIIIPKEDFCDNCNNDVCCCIIRVQPKQETLEEAKKYAELSYYGDEVDAFVRGVKWQKEQDKNKYSEEEVRKIVWESRKFFHEYKNTPFNKVRQVFYEWFEQFKKKIR